MRTLLCTLGILLLSATVGLAQTQLPIRFGANGAPLSPLQPVSYFGWGPIGGTYPLSDLVCAQEIAFTTEDPALAFNSPFNMVIPTSTQITNFYANPNGQAGQVILPADYFGITGFYPSLLSVSPSTDMLIRWAACKWGIDEDTLRAQMWQESQWHMDAAGDAQAGTVNPGQPGSCTPPGNSGQGTPMNTAIFNIPIVFFNATEVMNQGGCFQSYGIGQEKVSFFTTEFPTISQSTAFAVDLRAGAERGCIKGDQQAYFTSNNTCTAGQTAGHGTCSADVTNCQGGNAAACTDLQNGCVATHVSGDWWGPLATSYFASIQTGITNKPWPGHR